MLDKVHVWAITCLCLIFFSDRNYVTGFALRNENGVLRRKLTALTAQKFNLVFFYISHKKLINFLTSVDDTVFLAFQYVQSSILNISYIKK